MRIAVVNLSTLVTHEDAALMCHAVNAQIRHDYANAWNVHGHSLYFEPDPEAPVSPILAIVDDPPQGEDGVLGEHFEAEDMPQGLIYVRPVLDAGGGILIVPDGAPPGCAVSAVLSHEALELVGNPFVNRWADAKDGVSYAHEMCDACESDTYTTHVKTAHHAVKEVAVSNFVLPAYFDPEASLDRGDAFDLLRTIPAPFGLAPGGYKIVRDQGSNESAVTGEIPEWRHAAKSHPRSRTQRILGNPFADLDAPTSPTAQSIRPAVVVELAVRTAPREPRVRCGNVSRPKVKRGMRRG